MLSIYSKLGYIIAASSALLNIIEIITVAIIKDKNKVYPPYSFIALSVISIIISVRINLFFFYFFKKKHYLFIMQSKKNVFLL